MPKERNIKLFYIHSLLFQFSDNMLAIVLPVFLYKLFNSISAVFIFSLSWNLIYLILFIPIFNLAMHLKNPKYFMAIGVILYGISLWMFGHVTVENIRLIIPATIVFSLYISFYWLIRHWFFSVNADYMKIGKQISTLSIMGMIVSFAAPIIGGVLSQLVSFNITFMLGACAGTLSTIPVLLFYAPPHPRSYSVKKIITILRNRDLTAIRPAFFWEGISVYMTKTCWILAFAIFIGNIMKFGILTGVTTLLSVILTWMTGHWFDARRRAALLTKLTGIRVVLTLLYPAVFFFPNMAYIWIIEAMNKIISGMHCTVTDSYLFAYSNKIHPIHFHLNREIHMTISRIISSALLAIVFYFLPANFLWVSIGIGALLLFKWNTLKRSDHLLH
jgi:hypothetical protein